MLKAKTINDGAAGEDGYRLLITREWPKSLPASGADGFNPQLAPSATLYAALLKRRITFEEFGARYGAELEAQKERLAKLKREAKEFDITLVGYPDFGGKSLGQVVLEKCGAMASDTKKSPKVVIEEYQQKMAKKEGMGKGMAKEKKKTSKEPSAGFRFLEHTADIMVEAWGPNFAGALKQAALAMFSVMGKTRATAAFEVEERAAGREELVVQLLSRILAECEAHERVPAGIDILEYDEGANRMHVRIGYARTRPKDAIKAVTYHQLRVEEGKGGACRIRIVFDV